MAETGVMVQIQCPGWRKSVRISLSPDRFRLITAAGQDEALQNEARDKLIAQAKALYRHMTKESLGYVAWETIRANLEVISPQTLKREWSITKLAKPTPPPPLASVSLSGDPDCTCDTPRRCPKHDAPGFG